MADRRQAADDVGEGGELRPRLDPNLTVQPWMCGARGCTERADWVRRGSDVARCSYHVFWEGLAQAIAHERWRDGEEY